MNQAPEELSRDKLMYIFGVNYHPYCEQWVNVLKSLGYTTVEQLFDGFSRSNDDESLKLCFAHHYSETVFDVRCSTIWKPKSFCPLVYLE